MICACVTDLQLSVRVPRAPYSSRTTPHARVRPSFATWTSLSVMVTSRASSKRSSMTLAEVLPWQRFSSGTRTATRLTRRRWLQQRACTQASSSTAARRVRACCLVVTKRFYFMACLRSQSATVVHLRRFSLAAQLAIGNVLPVSEMPEGTIACNVESRVGDRGVIARCSGDYVTIIGHSEETGTTKIRMPSGMKKSVPSTYVMCPPPFNTALKRPRACHSGLIILSAFISLLVRAPVQLPRNGRHCCWWWPHGQADLEGWCCIP